ncbi:MAG: TRAP transporter substrate-binding protein DctP [Pseudomonadota bacterium]
MKRNVFLVMMVIGLFVFGQAAAAGMIEWKAQTSFPPEDSGTRHHAGGMVKATNEALKGRLNTTLFQLGQLVPEEEMGPALSQGVYDAAYMPAMARSEAGNVAFGLPFSWGSVDDVIEFYYDYGFLDWMRKHDAKQNVRFGCPMPWGPVALFSNFPVNKLEDYKGKKIWSWGLMSAVVEAFGGKPVWFDPGEVYMALKLGTIDGVLFGPAELETMKLKEVVKYISLPALIEPLTLDWSMSLESWNQLTPEMQEAYEKTMRENIKPMYEAIAEENLMGFKKAEEYGVKTIKLGDAEVARMKKAARETWVKLAEKDPAGAEAVKMLQDFLAKKGL